MGVKEIETVEILLTFNNFIRENDEKKMTKRERNERTRDVNNFYAQFFFSNNSEICIFSFFFLLTRRSLHC